MQHRSPKTELNDRILWFDGDSVVPVEQVGDAITSGLPTGNLFVDRMTDDIAEFNKYVPEGERIQLKTELRPIHTAWNLPAEYKDISAETLKLLFREIAYSMLNSENNLEHLRRLARIDLEFKRFEQHGLLDVLRTLLYIINTLEEQGIPWGVGRGSSVASYILYLIGVHDVDSIEHELDFDEFLPPL